MEDTTNVIDFLNELQTLITQGLITEDLALELLDCF